MRPFIDTNTYLKPFQTARASRALINRILKDTTIKLKGNKLLTSRALALQFHLDAAATKREQPVNLSVSDFTPHSPKTFQQVQQGYWASNYLSKDEEIRLRNKITQIIEKLDLKDKQLQHFSAHQQEATQEAKLALEKFKPKNVWFLFYLGKIFAFLTALGAGFCGAMVAMFITTGWGWPILLVSLAGIVIFAAHFILEIVLNRFTTPRHLVNLWKSGFKPTTDPDIAYINFKTYLPLILAIGSAAQVATLTYVSTQSILHSSLVLGGLTGVLATPSSDHSDSLQPSNHCLLIVQFLL